PSPFPTPGPFPTPTTRMYWTLEFAAYLEDAPWPATKDELIDYADRTGAPAEVIQNLQEMEDDGEPYESIEEAWTDYPTASEDVHVGDAQAGDARGDAVVPLSPLVAALRCGPPRSPRARRAARAGRGRGGAPAGRGPGRPGSPRRGAPHRRPAPD